MRKVVVVSLYGNPLHRGHIEYFRLAKEYAGEDGLVYAILNNDHQAVLKKGYSFVPEEDRLSIVSAIRYIDQAFLSIDQDRTVCKTLQWIYDHADHKPTHFANGGDVTPNAPCPEEEVCKKVGIELVYGLGDKVQSSTWILEKSVRTAYEKMTKK